MIGAVSFFAFSKEQHGSSDESVSGDPAGRKPEGLHMVVMLYGNPSTLQQSNMVDFPVIKESGGFGDPFLWSVAQVLSKFGGSVGGKKAAAAAGAIASWLRPGSRSIRGGCPMGLTSKTFSMH